MSIHQRLDLRCAVTGACIVSSIALTHAQQVTPVRRDNVVSFFAVSDLTTDPDAQPSLQGGIQAELKDWPASFYSTHPGGSCTSTLVGPRSLLTAAHCVPNKGTAVVKLKSKIYTGVCTHSPKYNPSSENGRTADWALCLMGEAVPVSPFETVNIDPSKVQVTTPLVLTGFGCTTSLGTGGNDGVYRIGPAVVTTLPSGDNNDIVTTGQAALCFGDSGGGAYTGSVETPQKRLQVSVNSRIGIDPTTKQLSKTSFLSSLSTPAAKEFLEAWSKSNSASICGVSQGATNCRPGI